MKIKIYLVIISLLFIKNYSQEKNENCKVLMPSISQEYKGECSNGLANGKGEAKGEDSFVGVFKEGFPNGKGKYTFQNGNFFEGNWQMGKKEGEGKFVYFISGKKMVQKGFWLNDEYASIIDPKESFVVTNRTNVPYYNFTKREDNQNKLVFSMSSANVKYVPSKFNIKTSSGTTLYGLKELIISDFRLPFHCEIEYLLIKNGVGINCNFTFDITKSGNYELQLIND